MQLARAEGARYTGYTHYASTVSGLHIPFVTYRHSVVYLLHATASILGYADSRAGSGLRRMLLLHGAVA